MKIKLSVILLAAASLTLPAAETTVSRKFYSGSSGDGETAMMEYEIKRGETLFTVAERFLGTPYKAEELAKANHITDPLRVEPGTRIKVPMAKAAVRYDIYRIDSEGEFLEHNPNDAMPGGDRFQIRVTSNTPGYLYAFNRSKDGAVRRIFPAGRRAAQVKAFSEYTLPAGSYFKLDRARGDEEIWLVLAAEPVTDLEALVDGSVIETARMKDFTNASTEKGIVIESEDEDGGPGEVVEAGQPGKFLLVHPIRIKRR